MGYALSSPLGVALELLVAAVALASCSVAMVSGFSMLDAVLAPMKQSDVLEHVGVGLGFAAVCERRRRGNLVEANASKVLMSVRNRS